MEVREGIYFAELIGIILGDGNIYDSGRHYILDISINRIDSPRYVDYVENLLFRIFKIKPKVNIKNDSKNLELRYFNKEIVKFLQTKGLHAGNKVKNQVGIPLWIKNNKDYSVSCLRGLIDTDGSIFVNKSNKSININFKSSSVPLVMNFKEICDGLKIKTSKLRINDKSKQSSYRLSIGSREEVAKFIYIVKPMKWIFNMQKIRRDLKQINLSLINIFTDKRNKGIGKYGKLLIFMN